jgi:L-lactate dehydrogenase (cytochrome)
MRIVEALRSVLRFERIETDPVARRLRRAASVEDLRRIAKRRLLTLPRVVRAGVNELDLAMQRARRRRENVGRRSVRSTRRSSR